MITATETLGNGPAVSPGPSTLMAVQDCFQPGTPHPGVRPGISRSREEALSRRTENRRNHFGPREGPGFGKARMTLSLRAPDERLSGGEGRPNPAERRSLFSFANC